MSVWCIVRDFIWPLYSVRHQYCCCTSHHWLQTDVTHFITLLRPLTMTRQPNTTEKLSIMLKDHFVPRSCYGDSISLTHYHRRNSALVSPSPNTWPFLEQIPMISLFKSTLPTYNNDTTTILSNRRDWTIAGWLEVRLGWNRCSFVSEEGCCCGVTLLLIRSECNLQRLVEALRFQLINVRWIKLHTVTADIVAMHKVCSLVGDGCLSTCIHVEWQGSVGLMNYSYATKRYTHS